MTKDKADIWMPLFIGDYLASTSRLTTEQHGAYLLLIMDYWKNGPLPDNDAMLAQISRMSPDAWSNARAVLKQFFSIANGEWRHGRIEKELANAKEQKQRNKERAKAAAQARWSRSVGNSEGSDCIGNDATSIATSTAKAMLEECPSPSPSPSPIKSTSKDSAGAPADKSASKRSRKIPDDFEPNEKHRAMAGELGVSLPDELAKFRDHFLANGKTMKSWDHAFSNWLRRAVEFKSGWNPPRPPKPQASSGGFATQDYSEGLDEHGNVL